ncbi:MAG: hypothetical protein CMN17_14190 [Roseovarius sp.]|nr:hypothetical protein [Roseovarius sp.]
MARIKRYLMAGAPLACALGTAYFMQAGAAPVAVQRAAPVSAAPVRITAIELTSAPALPAMPAPEGLPPAPVTRVVARDMPLPEALPGDEPAPGFACEAAMQATVLDGAMVRLDVSAPCKPDAGFTLHHTGMMVSARTDAQGQAAITLPALSQAAVFIAAFEGVAGGEGAVATAEVPDLAGHDRFVVQWRGDAESLRLHALEYGADFGEPGHVWSGAEAPEGAGRLVRLGFDMPSPAFRAEVYTFPTQSAARDGSVALRLEAEVTDGNCGRDLEAQSLRIGPSTGTVVRDVVLPMPDCAALGEFLVLQNLFDDLKIAQK